MPPRQIRVSVVEFLNAVPLTWGFVRGYFPRQFRVSRDKPAVCASKLLRGAVDVGLVPSIAFQSMAGLRILPDLCIAANGEVKSVLLLSRGRSLRTVSSVAADPASRASAALVRVLLGERHGVVPEMVEVSGAPRSLLRRFDAVLCIGDRALRVRRTGLEGMVVHDLAAVWKRLTGLPFVFAVWAVGRDVELGEASRCFPFSRALGLGHLDEIVEEAHESVGLPRQELLDYFTRNLVYQLGERERRGLELFYRLALRHGVIDEVRPLAFYGDPE